MQRLEALSPSVAGPLFDAELMSAIEGARLTSSSVRKQIKRVGTSDVMVFDGHIATPGDTAARPVRRDHPDTTRSVRPEKRLANGGREGSLSALLNCARRDNCTSARGARAPNACERDVARERADDVGRMWCGLRSPG
jgi:hypothetical protein